ncbi:MAG: hypothetical protein RIT24_2209, partial [Planctomycetota bacterium]
HDIDACALPAIARGERGKTGPLDETVQLSDGERIICTIASVSVGEVLARDHRKDEFAIVARDATVEEALSLWTRNPRLEAVIITERGRAEETPLGIATATDLIKLLEQRG